MVCVVMPMNVFSFYVLGTEMHLAFWFCAAWTCLLFVVYFFLYLILCLSLHFSGFCAIMHVCLCDASSFLDNFRKNTWVEVGV